jgi:hypothetical protein
MEKSFTTLAELQAEIRNLNTKRYAQEIAIKAKFDGPMASIKSIGSILRGGGSDKKSFFNQDLVTNVSRFILPILLNSSIFKNSGLITKAVVAIFSQKAAKKINTDSIISVVDKLKNMIKGKEHTLKPAVDYGIPPDSETY